MTSKTVTTCTFMVIETGKATATALQEQGIPSCKAGVFTSELFKCNTPFCSVMTISTFLSPGWRKWKNTWEACFTTENLKTWREGMRTILNLSSQCSLYVILWKNSCVVSHTSWIASLFYVSHICMLYSKAGNDHVLECLKLVRLLNWNKL